MQFLMQLLVIHSVDHFDYSHHHDEVATFLRMAPAIVFMIIGTSTVVSSSISRRFLLSPGGTRPSGNGSSPALNLAKKTESWTAQHRCHGMSVLHVDGSASTRTYLTHIFYFTLDLSDDADSAADHPKE